MDACCWSRDSWTQQGPVINVHTRENEGPWWVCHTDRWASQQGPPAIEILTWQGAPLEVWRASNHMKTSCSIARRMPEELPALDNTCQPMSARFSSSTGLGFGTLTYAIVWDRFPPAQALDRNLSPNREHMADDQSCETYTSWLPFQPRLDYLSHQLRRKKTMQRLLSIAFLQQQGFLTLGASRTFPVCLLS